ncbi:MAG: DUF2079 domain-containing protein [Archangiaceae bacterium]|nr:DUF2079 domain-containing protein [Archangiaceae bacterium]
MLVRTARAALALGLIAAAVTHALTTELTPVTTRYFSDNLVPPEPRNLVLLAMALTFAAVAGAVLVLARRESERSAAGAWWLARLTCPLLGLPVALALVRRSWADEGVVALTLAMFVLALERLLREAAGAWAERPQGLGQRLLAAPRAFFARPRLVLGTLVALAAAHAAFMALWAVFAHQRFFTYGADLGQYDQVFQSVLAGRPLRLPTLGWDTNWGGLNGHADLATFYLLPLYALHPRAETLLVMQAAALAFSAVPIFLFARSRLPLPHAFALGLAWLLYAPFHGAQLYDVHMQPFGASWAMWAIAMAELRRFKTYWLFFAFAILCREDVSIGLATLGGFMFLSGWRVRTGAATALVSVVYFLGLRFVLMPNQYFADTFKLLYPPGESGFVAVLKTLVSNPGYTLKTLIRWEKLSYVGQVFAPLAFLPLRRPLHWLLLVNGFLLTVISTAYPPTIQISFQYVCNWAPYAFAAAAMTLAAFADDREGRVRRAAGAWAVVVATAVACLQWGAYSPHAMVHGGFVDVPFLAPSDADRQREVDLQAVMTHVPGGAALCAADRVQAHVTWHLNTWSIVDDVHAHCELLIFGDLANDLGAARSKQAIASGRFEVLAQRGDITLARRVPGR